MDDDDLYSTEASLVPPPPPAVAPKPLATAAKQILNAAVPSGVKRPHQDEEDLTDESDDSVCRMVVCFIENDLMIYRISNLL